MTSEAQQRAHAELRKRRIKEGLSPVTVWLSKAAKAKLVKLAKAHGSNAAAIEALLLKPSVPIAPKAVVDRLSAQALPVQVVEEVEVPKVTGAVQYGPVKRKPGELAKKGKKR